MRPERLTLFLIFIASLVLLAGMGIVATSQAQESFVSPNTDLLKSQPAAWLFFPGLMIMSAGIVSTVVALEAPGEVPPERRAPVGVGDRLAADPERLGHRLALNPAE